MRVLFLLLIFLLSACGSDGPDWNIDNTCYECESVCDGVVYSEAWKCFDQCDDCQGSSQCFTLMENRYEGQSATMESWSPYICVIGLN